MALGFAPALLQHMAQVAQPNYAGSKITPSGFLKALLQNNPNLAITSVNGQAITGMKLSTTGGAVREVRLKYLPRIISSQIAEEDNCDNNQVFQYTETTLSAPKRAKFGFFVDWNFVEKYIAEVQQITNGGVIPAYGAVAELWAQLQHVVNGLVTKIDTDLLSAVTWGVNVVPGNNAAKTININKDGSVLDLSNGVIEILSDYAVNEFTGAPIIVGSGLMNKYELSKVALAAGGGSVQNLAALTGYQWYHDIQAATNANFGANGVGVFAPGTVGFVDIDKYVGFKAGSFGTSHFGTIMLPVETAPGAVQMMNFNIQIKEVDCPEEDFDGYETRVLGRGYKVLITKQYGLFQQPTNSYQAGDRLAGNNGSLRYTITNVCDGCPEAENGTPN